MLSGHLIVSCLGFLDYCSNIIFPLSHSNYLCYVAIDVTSIIDDSLASYHNQKSDVSCTLSKIDPL